MPFTFTDTFFIMDPYNPPPTGTLLTATTMTVVDQNDDGDVDRSNNDSIDGVDIRTVYVNDTVTIITLSGETITYTGATFYLRDGRQVFTPTDGQNVVTGALVSTSWTTSTDSVEIPEFESAPPCFTPGTLIETATGPKPVEELGAGDLVLTADRGLAPVAFVRKRHLPQDHLTKTPKHGPIRIARDALGRGLPVRDLIVSPQHRMVLRSDIALRMFGVSEIMVAATHLLDQPGVRRESTADGVDYYHILLDHHAVLYAEDTPTESLFLGAEIAEGFTQRDMDVLRARLPKTHRAPMTPARTFVRGPRLRKLLERHVKNDKPLIAPMPHQQMEWRKAG